MGDLPNAVVKRLLTQHGGDRAALLEAGQAEAADAGQADADVELAGVLQVLHLRGREQLGEQLARLQQEHTDLVVELERFETLCIASTLAELWSL